MNRCARILLFSSISLFTRPVFYRIILPQSSPRTYFIFRRFSKMPPVPQKSEAISAHIEEVVNSNSVTIFSKSWCPFCKKVKELFKKLNVSFYALELDVMPEEDGALYQQVLKQKTGISSVPQVYVNGTHIGGCDDTHKIHSQNKLLPLLAQTANGSTMAQGDTAKYDYDLIVIGGGSGGLAASKEAAKFGMNVAVCDFVKPTPIGTSWGLGGTCVNVGCIPKKLVHQAALLGQSVSDAPHYGWDLSEQTVSHDWLKLKEAVQNYIGSLNWGYRVALKEGKVNYLNEFAEFVDAHTIETKNKKNKVQRISSANFLIAVGGRPRYPDIPGALEYGITSDDLFSLSYNPGITVCIGASYIALECAGFLNGLGLETTVVARSILLRGFDQQLANMIGDHMEGHGVKFYRGWVPISVEKLEDGTPPKLLVTIKSDEGDLVKLEVNTVVFAIGRDPCTPDLKLDNAGVRITMKSGKILTDEADRTNVPHIYAIGDVAEGRPELTPVAIQAGVLLSRRLFGGQTILTDYDKIPTTVFTPLEYGCIGLSEEEAVSRHGTDNIEVYHSNFQTLEAAIPKRDENKCYAKLVCLKSEQERIVGFHYLGPNAGEITQGFALGIKLGATKSDFDSLIGIHPTSAETFTTLDVTKSSGVDSLKKGC